MNNTVAPRWPQTHRPEPDVHTRGTGKGVVVMGILDFLLHVSVNLKLLLERKCSNYKTKR